MIGLALIAGMTGEALANKKSEDKKAKYIFLFIGDGMGLNQVAVTESYLSYKEGKINGESLVFSDTMTSIEGINVGPETRKALNDWIDGRISIFTVFEEILLKYGIMKEKVL